MSPAAGLPSSVAGPQSLVWLAGLRTGGDAR